MDNMAVADHIPVVEHYILAAIHNPGYILVVVVHIVTVDTVVEDIAVEGIVAEGIVAEDIVVVD